MWVLQSHRGGYVTYNFDTRPEIGYAMPFTTAKAAREIGVDGMQADRVVPVLVTITLAKPRARGKR